MKFELTLLVREDDEIKCKSIDTIKGSDLLQVLAQLPFVVINLQRKLDEEKRISDEEIPF